MKIIISESQHRRLFEGEQKVLHIPDLKIFGNDWDVLQRFLESKGFPLYSLGGNLNLVGLEVESLGNLVSVQDDLYAYNTPLKSLGKLTSVGGDLDLSNTQIESLENLVSVQDDLYAYNTPLKSLGKLTSVGGNLDLYDSSIESLGNLTFVGGDLHLIGTPISKKYSKEEIRQMVNVGGDIYL